jgi:hypothetical protein
MDTEEHLFLLLLFDRPATRHHRWSGAVKNQHFLYKDFTIFHTIQKTKTKARDRGSAGACSRGGGAAVFTCRDCRLRGRRPRDRRRGSPSEHQPITGKRISRKASVRMFRISKKFSKIKEKVNIYIK